MYSPGKVLILGGSTANGVTNTAEIIDIGSPATAAFLSTAAMTFPRTHVNATILADGSVLATGGSRTKSVHDYDGVLHAELWRPPSRFSPGGTWTLLNEMSVPRLYHATAVLLPDATVLTTGGGEGAGHANHPDYQIFTPPYLCNGLARPHISLAPVAVAYNTSFTVTSPNAATIARATWVRLSSVTHAFNMNQRFMDLHHAYNRPTGAAHRHGPYRPERVPARPLHAVPHRHPGHAFGGQHRGHQRHWLQHRAEH